MLIYDCFQSGTLETEGSEDGGKSQSPLGNIKKKHQPTLTPRQSEKNLSVTELNKNSRGDKGSKLIPKFGGIGELMQVSSDLL